VTRPDRTLDRQLAYLGLLGWTPHLSFSARGRRYPVSVCCWHCRVWSRVGCFGSAASSTVTSVRPSTALRTTLLTLLLMGLLRIKRPRASQGRKDPAAFRQASWGLNRSAPEVKTLRRRLTRLGRAVLRRAARRGACACACRSAPDTSWGFLYVDGHVRAYHGPTPHLIKCLCGAGVIWPCRPATDYWVNDGSGDPLLVITGEGRRLA